MLIKAGCLNIFSSSLNLARLNRRNRFINLINPFLQRQVYGAKVPRNLVGIWVGVFFGTGVLKIAVNNLIGVLWGVGNTSVALINVFWGVGVANVRVTILVGNWEGVAVGCSVWVGRGSSSVTTLVITNGPAGPGTAVLVAANSSMSKK